MSKIKALFLISMLYCDAFAIPNSSNGDSDVVESEIDHDFQDIPQKVFTEKEKNEIFSLVKRRLIENGFDIELNRNSIVNENKLIIGGIRDGTQRNVIEKVLDILTEMTWIEDLSFGNNMLKSLPASIGKFTQLKRLSLFGTIYLQSLPADIGKLTQLTWLDVSSNDLRTLPAEIGKLTNLTMLKLSNNQLTQIPSEIGNLRQLKTLNLATNRLIKLPAEIGNLTQLEQLILTDNRLTFVPDEIENLKHVTLLALDMNRLTSLPSNIGKLERLTDFRLYRNQLISIPSNIADIQGLNILYLNDNRDLLPQGQNATEWGRQELSAHFGDRVILGKPIIKAMSASTKKEEVNQNLDKASFRLNRSTFAAQKLPEIKVDHVFTGQEMLDALAHIVADLNFFDPNKTDYLSYEVLANDFASDARDQNISNFDKVFHFFLPRLTGYIKTLYDLPLKENDVAGWKMYEPQIPETQKALTFVLQKIQEQADSDVKMLLFYQLVNGLLHCPTGQTEGINSVVYALLENSYKISDFKTDLERYLALKKNDFFGTAILSKGGDNSQNVHLISSYRNQLKDELGLSAAIDSYKERIGIMGQDPFSGNKWNVVYLFYSLVSPDRLTDWVMSKTETRQDRQDSFDLRHLRSKNLPAEEHEKETLRLRTKINLNHQHRNFTIGKIAEYLYQEKLISDNEDDTRWKMFFTADPLFDDFALLTRDGAKRILIHMGFLINNMQPIRNANNNNNNNNNFDNRNVSRD